MKKQIARQIKTPLFWAQAAIIATLYTALSVGLAPFSFGPIQLRVSEALCVLLAFTFAAVPGLFVGCVLSNLIGLSMGLSTLPDVICGSIATLLAAVLGYLLRKNTFLLPLPTVLVNAVIVGWVVHTFFTPSIALVLCMIYVGIGQVLACYAIGLPLLYLLRKSRAIEQFFAEPSAISH